MPIALNYSRIATSARLLAAFAGMGAVTLAPQVQAQEDYRAIVTIMRACAQIEDVAARVMCYDNNIRPSAAVAGATASSGALASGAAPASAPAVPQNAGSSSFGSEMLETVRRTEREQESGSITARVAAISSLEPGIYLVTLADGAQWRFVDAATGAWYPPQPGDEIELERGSLGSVFLKYDDQRRLRVRRVR